MQIDTRGSCLCGSVTFNVSGVVTDCYICHCTRCRKETGSAFATSIFVPLQAVLWLSGRQLTRRYELPDSDYFCLDFCGRCGSVVPYRSRDQTFYIVPAGCLDGDIVIAPVKQIYFDDRAKWYDSGIASPHFSSSEGGRL